MLDNMRKKMVVLGGTTCLILLPVVATLLGHDYFISLFTRILIYALAAVSLDLLLGFGGLVSLGHAAFFGVGGYVVGILFYHASEEQPLLGVIPGSENALVVLPVAVFVSALFAIVIGSLSLRTKGMHFIMITLAFAQMIFYFFVGLEKYGGDDGLSLYARNRMVILDLSDDIQFYYFCLFFLIIFVFFAYRLVQSRFGLVIRGVSLNERRVRALGIGSYNYKLVCFVIGGAGAGLAGALLANQTEYVSPGMMHWTLSGELMVMVLIGGLGTLFGPIVGSAIFILLEDILGMYTEHWMVYMGPLLVLIVLFAPQGLFGLLAGKRGPDG
jgi:branched-chain amino acid transport system permease protein